MTYGSDAARVMVISWVIDVSCLLFKFPLSQTNPLSSVSASHSFIVVSHDVSSLSRIPIIYHLLSSSFQPPLVTIILNANPQSSSRLTTHSLSHPTITTTRTPNKMNTHTRINCHSHRLNPHIPASHPLLLNIHQPRYSLRFNDHRFHSCVCEYFDRSINYLGLLGETGGNVLIW
jgi:hypothetical protein